MRLRTSGPVAQQHVVRFQGSVVVQASGVRVGALGEQLHGGGGLPGPCGRSTRG